MIHKEVVMFHKNLAAKISVVCLSLALVIGGCSSSGGEAAVDLSHNGSKVEVEAGGVLVVSLESNPTTGYMWEIEEIDDEILRQEGEVEYKAESDLVGAGGVETFRFKALTAGEGELKLVYRRPWEGGIEPLEIFSITVIVK
jgi:inhibitor of cysteine peptidase